MFEVKLKQKRKWDCNNLIFTVIGQTYFNDKTWFVIQYDNDGRKQTLTEHELLTHTDVIE